MVHLADETAALVRREQHGEVLAVPEAVGHGAAGHDLILVQHPHHLGQRGAHVRQTFDGVAERDGVVEQHHGLIQQEDLRETVPAEVLAEDGDGAVVSKLGPQDAAVRTHHHHAVAQTDHVATEVVQHARRAVHVQAVREQQHRGRRRRAGLAHHVGVATGRQHVVRERLGIPRADVAVGLVEHELQRMRREAGVPAVGVEDVQVDVPAGVEALLVHFHHVLARRLAQAAVEVAPVDANVLGLHGVAVEVLAQHHVRPAALPAHGRDVALGALEDGILHADLQGLLGKRHGHGHDVRDEAAHAVWAIDGQTHEMRVGAQQRQHALRPVAPEVFGQEGPSHAGVQQEEVVVLLRALRQAHAPRAEVEAGVVAVDDLEVLQLGKHDAGVAVHHDHVVHVAAAGQHGVGHDGRLYEEQQIGLVQGVLLIVRKHHQDALPLRHQLAPVVARLQVSAIELGAPLRIAADGDAGSRRRVGQEQRLVRVHVIAHRQRRRRDGAGAVAALEGAVEDEMLAQLRPAHTAQVGVLLAVGLVITLVAAADALGRLAAHEGVLRGRQRQMRQLRITRLPVRPVARVQHHDADVGLAPDPPAPVDALRLPVQRLKVQALQQQQPQQVGAAHLEVAVLQRTEGRCSHGQRPMLEARLVSLAAKLASHQRQRRSQAGYVRVEPKLQARAGPPLGEERASGVGVRQHENLVLAPREAVHAACVHTEAKRARARGRRHEVQLVARGEAHGLQARLEVVAALARLLQDEHVRHLPLDAVGVRLSRIG
eukprot:scaffold492_cov257-Pinguiococcus_pyrenoidosus.AAC.7